MRSTLVVTVLYIVAGGTGGNAEIYLKKEGYRCPKVYDSFNNLDEAKASCDADPTCGKINNDFCDGTHFKLCKKGILLESSVNGPCAYVKVCDFSEEACKDVGALMGRTFKSSSAYATKGCYLYYSDPYGSDIYYGTGGSETERTSKLPKAGTKKRPLGFDCNGVNFLAQSDKTECKAGTSKISTATKCRKAAKELGLRFAKTAHWSDKPGGCFHNWGIHIENIFNQANCRRGEVCVYFNSYIGSTGKASPPICKIDKRPCDSDTDCTNEGETCNTNSKNCQCGTAKSCLMDRNNPKCDAANNKCVPVHLTFDKTCCEEKGVPMDCMGLCRLDGTLRSLAPLANACDRWEKTAKECVIED